MGLNGDNIKIEEIKNMLYSRELDHESITEISKFISLQQSKINQVEADKLEAYKIIEEDSYACNKSNTINEYVNCERCGTTDEYGEMVHDKNCIALKANKYIKEVEK